MQTLFLLLSLIEVLMIVLFSSIAYFNEEGMSLSLYVYKISLILL